MCKDPVMRESPAYLKTRDGSSQTTLGLVGQIKDLDFYSKSNGRPLNGF